MPGYKSQPGFSVAELLRTEVRPLWDQSHSKGNSGLTRGGGKDGRKGEREGGVYQVYALLSLIAVGSSTHVFQMIDKLLIVSAGKEVSSKMCLKEYIFLNTFSKNIENVYICYEPVVFKELLDLF